MKPIVELITPYQGLFSLVIFLWFLARVMYFEKKYTDRINNSWIEADDATRWITKRFSLRFIPVTMLALSLLYITGEDFFEKTSWAEENTFYYLFLFKFVPALSWALLSLYSICVACECCIFSRKSIFEEIQTEETIINEKHGMNRRRKRA